MAPSIVHGLVAALIAIGSTTGSVTASASAPDLAAPSTPAAAAPPLAGKVIGVDPGHNGANGSDPAFLDHQIWNGRESEDCDTTGTETNAGYPEHLFTWRVAQYLTADLKAAGARVVLTRHSDSGLGPCVDRRARTIDRAHANVAVDIHGDGGPADGRGFAILEPVADGTNNRVLGSSYRLARILRASFRTGTGMPYSTYDGTDALVKRNDLAGLNLTTVPKVLIECGNMRNATDAALMTSPRWQRRAARAMYQALLAYLRR
jgi:N-acetylmuramoyl-L-alanine amidase